MTAVDLGIWLMELRFFSHNMNQDGSLPTERFRTLWEAMLETGDIERAWDYKRHAAMRNYLSSLGLLEWEDERYSPGCGGQKGQAAKWRASKELLAMLDELEMVEEKKEEDTSLTGTTTIELPKLVPNKSFLKPIQVVNIRKWMDYRPVLIQMGLMAA